ncbi:MAG: hypothetical protein ACXVQY_12305 [Actinomycetota bacterium]
MARRKRFVGLGVAAVAIAGIALYLPSAAPFINGYPVGSGYGGNNCPVGISFDASPNRVVYGGAFSISGQLVPGASPAVPVSGQSIAIKRVVTGTSTVLNTKTVTTGSNGFFSTTYVPAFNAFHYGTWTDPHSLCPAEKSGQSVGVRVRMGISRSTAIQAAGRLFYIRGSVRPNKAGDAVRLKVWRVGAPTRFTIYTTRLNSLSNFQMRFVSNSHNVYYAFRAFYTAQDSLNMSNYSAVVLVHIL